MLVKVLISGLIRIKYLEFTYRIPVNFTKILREKGSMLGKIVRCGKDLRKLRYP